MNPKNYLKIVSLIVVGLTAVTAQSSAQGIITFSDGNFSGWNISAYSPYPGQSVTVTNAGGNPSSYVLVTTTTSALTETEFYNPLFTYDPSGGAISNISYSLDIKEFATYGQGMAYELLLMQGGQTYLSGFQITQGNGNVWNTRTTSGLTAANFVNASSQHPDFSTAGGMLTFGFLTANETGNGIIVGYDNYNVQIHPVPEPTSVVLLGLGGLALMAARRRIAS